MENEIELKLMIKPEHIPALKTFFAELEVVSHKTEALGNSYYDTRDRFFAQHKMGLRVRQKNQQFELTLKTQGEVKDGLHIRPEYNLPLPDSQPNFIALVEKFGLDFPDAAKISANLTAIFSTDFVREKWLVSFNQSQIEIALDQGEIKNTVAQTPICEIELELKSGDVTDLHALLKAMPEFTGMELGNLSKAERGYLLPC